VEVALSWRPLPAATAPAEVAAGSGAREVAGFGVGATAFASATTGWAVVGGPGASRLMYTSDAGATWTPQLAWHGYLMGNRLTAFDASRAGLVLGASLEDSDVIGVQLESGRYTAVFGATENGGTTWRLGPVPDSTRFTGMFHYLTAHQLWLVQRSGSFPAQTSLARTDDGGATWTEADVPEGSLVAFASPNDGVLIAPRDGGPDMLHVTGDGGGTWTAHRLPEPADVPAAIGGSLHPVTRPGTAVVLLLRSIGGVYAYDGSHGWSQAHRLPMKPTRDRLHLLAFGGGQICAASGHDLWFADDLGGPWEHRPVPLPPEETIADAAPVGAGVLWLTTTRHPAPGTPPSGRLYRTANAGAAWTPVPVSVPGEGKS
jgi:hypothetical protein